MYVLRWPRISASHECHRETCACNSFQAIFAIDFPKEVLPTPGGPYKHKMVLMSCFTSKQRDTPGCVSLLFSNPKWSYPKSFLASSNQSHQWYIFPGKSSINQRNHHHRKIRCLRVRALKFIQLFIKMLSCRLRPLLFQIPRCAVFLFLIRTIKPSSSEALWSVALRNIALLLINVRMNLLWIFMLDLQHLDFF